MIDDYHWHHAHSDTSLLYYSGHYGSDKQYMCHCCCWKWLTWSWRRVGNLVSVLLHYTININVVWLWLWLLFVITISIILICFISSWCCWMWQMPSRRLRGRKSWRLYSLMFLSPSVLSWDTCLPSSISQYLVLSPV